MTEKDFQQQIIDLARHMNYLCAHFRPALTQRGRWVTPVKADGAGYPDLTLVRAARSDAPGRTIFVEVKAGKGRLSIAQEAWRDAIVGASVAEWYCWRWPDDDIEHIREVLR